MQFIGYPALVLLYLGNYPKGKWSQIPYVLAWVLLQCSIEAVSHFIAGGIAYSNGWRYGWSVLFDIFFYVILRIHYLNPLLAWGIAGVAIILRICFLLPTAAMK